MKLTRSSDYAIRLLIHLARKGEGTSRVFAEELKIPFNHLAKVVQALSRHGFIASRKGKGGGISLARGTRKIVVGKVIEAIEGPLTLSDCLLDGAVCDFSKQCTFRKKLGQVRQKLIGLFSITIYDLA